MYNWGMKPSERGSAMIMLFIAVALFAALAFAFMQGTRGGINMLQDEQSKATATSTQDCTNAVNLAAKRLQLRGCGDKVSYLSDGSNTATGAPMDGSCSIFHPNGGGVKACNASALAPPSLTGLLPGESLGGIIYVGVAANGKRIYTTPTNHSTSAKWSAGITVNVAGLSATQGSLNTDTLTGLANADVPYEAANLCRALGAEWYLPSTNELYLVLKNATLGDLNGTINYTDWYWSSTQFSANQAYRMQADPVWEANTSSTLKSSTVNVRCVRSD